MKQAKRSRFIWAALIPAIVTIAFTPPASADPQRSWVLPAKNISAAGQNSFDAQIAAAANGSVTAVWRNFRGRGATIQAATRPPGGSFGPAVNISGAGLGAYGPQIAIGPNGAAIAVWYRTDGYEGTVQAAIRPPGGSFGAPVDLSAAGKFVDQPQVAIARNGAATVVWTTHKGGYSDIIQAATRPPGGSFGPAVNLSVSGPGTSSSSPQIGIAPNGTATVVWYRARGNASKIQAATRLPGGSFGAPVNLSPAGEDDIFPQIAIAPDGTATVVWSRYTVPDHRVQAVTRASGGAFKSAVNLSAPGRNAYNPQIAVAPGGGVTVVWRRSNGANNIIQAATRPAGGSFGAAANLSAVGQDADVPQIAIAPDRTTTVLWQRSAGGKSIIQAATRPPGRPFGAAVSLAAPGRIAYNAQIAIAANGVATAIWQRYNGSKSMIQSASTAQPSRIGKVRVSGPARVKRGRVAIYRVRITNSGKTAATGVRLKVSGRGAGFNAPVGRIAVGTTRTVNVRVRPNRPGRVVATFRVMSFNAGGKTVKKRIFVRR